MFSPTNEIHRRKNLIEKSTSFEYLLIQYNLIIFLLVSSQSNFQCNNESIGVQPTGRHLRLVVEKSLMDCSQLNSSERTEREKGKTPPASFSFTFLSLSHSLS